MKGVSGAETIVFAIRAFAGFPPVRTVDFKFFVPNLSKIVFADISLDEFGAPFNVPGGP